MIEATLSIVIVGVMLVAGLNTLGSTRMTQHKLGYGIRAAALAEDLMSEILQQYYEDPDLAPGSFGRSIAEDDEGDRTLFDDVDDYDGWSASPPQDRDGAPLVGANGYTRSVSVDWVLSSDLNQTSVSATGIKRISVFVSHADGVRISLYALRTVMWENPADVMGGGP